MFAPLHCLNFSIDGDQTQNVLWRCQNGELDNMSPQVGCYVSELDNMSSHGSLIYTRKLYYFGVFSCTNYFSIFQ